MCYIFIAHPSIFIAFIKSPHCMFSSPFSIGYPVVTLGFGFKSYVSYKMRLRKQKEVQKENEFYMQLLQQALPPEQQMLQRQEREAEEGETHTDENTHENTTLMTIIKAELKHYIYSAH